MDESPTTVIIQRYLDALPGDALAGDTAAEPIIRECASFLYKSYPRPLR